MDLPLYGFFTKMQNSNYSFYNKKKKYQAKCLLRKHKGESILKEGNKILYSVNF